MQRGLAVVTAAALVATALPLPASAAAKGRTAQAATVQVATDGSTDFSARRARRGNNAAAAAMFGLVAGTIATIAINDQRRQRERDYWRHRHGYYHGYYHAPARYYHAPPAYYGPPRHHRYYRYR